MQTSLEGSKASEAAKLLKKRLPRGQVSRRNKETQTLGGNDVSERRAYSGLREAQAEVNKMRRSTEPGSGQGRRFTGKSTGSGVR